MTRREATLRVRYDVWMLVDGHRAALLEGLARDGETEEDMARLRTELEIELGMLYERATPK